MVRTPKIFFRVCLFKLLFWLAQILRNNFRFDEKIGSLNVRPPWTFYFLTVRGGKMSVNFKWCHIDIGIIYEIEICFVKLYTWTQQNKGTFNSLSWPQFSIVTFRRNEVSDFYSHLHNILICSLSFQPKVWIWVWVWRGIRPSFVHCCPLSSRVGWKIENVKNSLWTSSSWCNSQK